MKSRDDKIADLEHQIVLLKQKLEIAELQAVIETKKRERAEAERFGRNPWTVTYGGTTMYTTTNGVSELTRRISDAYRGKHAQ
jgi:hypothetical protein